MRNKSYYRFLDFHRINVRLLIFFERINLYLSDIRFSIILGTLVIPRSFHRVFSNRTFIINYFERIHVIVKKSRLVVLGCVEDYTKFIPMKIRVLQIPTLHNPFSYFVDTIYDRRHDRSERISLFRNVIKCLRVYWGPF